MAKPELHAGMADLARAGRESAQTDDARAAYDRAWAAHFTAHNHARLALQNQALAEVHRRNAAIAATKRDGAADAEAYRAAAAQLDAYAAQHQRRADERAEEGHGHMIAAAAVPAPAKPAAPKPVAPKEASA